MIAKLSSDTGCISSIRRGMGFIAAVLITALVVNFTGCAQSDSESDQKNETEKPAVETDQPAIPWNLDYQAGMKLAQEQNKPILMVFTTTWCPPCLQMKEKVYPDPEVIKTAQAFVPILIDFDVQGYLAQQYQVTAIPTYFILQPDGAQIDTFLGYHEALEFIEKLRAALKKSTGAVDQASDSRDSENINETTNLEVENNRLENPAQAKIANAHTDIALLEKALAVFSMDCGRFPTQNEGLDALQLSPTDLASRWAGPYFKGSPLVDPWQNPYVYIFPATISSNEFDLISYGADGIPGGEGINADILNK